MKFLNKMSTEENTPLKIRIPICIDDGKIVLSDETFNTWSNALSFLQKNTYERKRPSKTFNDKKNSSKVFN